MVLVEEKAIVKGAIWPDLEQLLEKEQQLAIAVLHNVLAEEDAE